MKSVNDIIDVLISKDLIKYEYLEVNKLKSGTTNGILYLLLINKTPAYVIKIDHPHIITPTQDFLIAYSNVNLLPRVLYTDVDGEFIVYTYIAGETHYNCGSKKDWMTLLVKSLFNSYKKVENDQPWGRVNGFTYETWSDFNKSSFEYARNKIGDVLPSEDHIKVEVLMNKLNISHDQEEKYYIHGDTGVHNFVYADKQLKGVIDPSPLIAPIIYDFTYAFCSSPDSLDLDTLFSSFKCLNIQESFTSERLINEVLFQFYTRIGICIKAHPHDLSCYKEAWSQWRNALPNI